jgi:ParB family chromosome partitioning protein
LVKAVAAMSKPTLGNLALTSFDDIFNLESHTIGDIIEAPLSELNQPDNHPFLVCDDDAMTRLAESVKRYGVREPGIARKLADGGYELLCGNRRKRACELAGITSMPVIVRELTDDEAAVVMVDSNLLHRERILPSEKAWAYRIKMEALNHSGVKGEQQSFEVVASQTGESKNQIYRLIRLTELVDALLNKVDARQLAFNPAVELSYLSYDEQHIVAKAMEAHEVKPSLSQAVRLKKLKQDGKLTAEVVDAILSEEKTPPKSERDGTLRFRKFFPSDYSAKQMETVIVKLLTDWQASATA